MIQFRNTIEVNGEVLLSENFDTKKEAQKSARKLMKRFTLIRHAGHIVNYSEYTELWTNY